jgi:hypothetical protein
MSPFQGLTLPVETHGGAYHRSLLAYANLKFKIPHKIFPAIPPLQQQQKKPNKGFAPC